MSRPLGWFWAGGEFLAFFLVVAVGFVARPAIGLPSISEVFYDAVGSDNGQSFVELYGVPGASLAGFVLEGVNGAGGGIGPSLDLSGVIGVDGLFVVADDQGDGTTLVSNVDAILNFDFQIRVKELRGVVEGTCRCVARRGGTSVPPLGGTAGSAKGGHLQASGEPGLVRALVPRRADPQEVAWHGRRRGGPRALRAVV